MFYIIANILLTIFYIVCFVKCKYNSNLLRPSFCMCYALRSNLTILFCRLRKHSRGFKRSLWQVGSYTDRYFIPHPRSVHPQERVPVGDDHHSLNQPQVIHGLTTRRTWHSHPFNHYLAELSVLVKSFDRLHVCLQFDQQAAQQLRHAPLHYNLQWSLHVNGHRQADEKRKQDVVDKLSRRRSPNWQSLPTSQKKLKLDE